MTAVTQLGNRAEMPGPGELKRFVRDGVALCVANIDGELRAIQDECPHKGVSLSEGWLKGKRIVCPKHEWRFRTKDGACKAHPGFSADVYPLFVWGQDVLVQL